MNFLFYNINSETTTQKCCIFLSHNTQQSFRNRFRLQEINLINLEIQRIIHLYVESNVTFLSYHAILFLINDTISVTENNWNDYKKTADLNSRQF